MSRRAVIGTWNVLHGVDVRSGDVALDRTTEVLEALDADVVALQEVDRGLERSGGTDQVAALAERLGLHGVFAPALLGDPDRHWWLPPPGGDLDGPAFGVGLLARRPLERVRVVRLPGGGAGRRRRPGTPTRPGWDREPRVVLAAQVALDGGALTLVTTHLSYLPWRAVRQLRALARRTATAGGPALLAGDLNVPAAADGPALLAGDLNLPAAVVRRAAGPGWRHLGGEPTYPAWRPRVQPDHLLAAGPVDVTDVRVGPDVVSDHRPLVATLRLRG